MARTAARKVHLGMDTGLEARDVPALLTGLSKTALFTPHTSTSLITTSLIRDRLFLLPQYETRLSGGTLFITGSAWDDKVKVTSNDSAQTVQVEAEGRPTATYNLPDVKKIQFVGNAGNDSFVNDTAIPAAAWGDGGNDALLGGSAADVLVGGTGNDTLDGRGGDDRLWGEAGHDKIAGGEGNDYEVGGSGRDTLAGSWAGSTFVDDPGNDTVFGESGNDWSDGGSGNDLMYMGSGHDFAAGGVGNDTLFGEAGNDVLHGWEGDDHLHGQWGDDVLDGQAGFDQMYGGDDYDTATADRAFERMWDCEAAQLQGVPGGDPRPNGENSCGPNSASRVLRYYGFADATYSRLKREAIYDGDLISRVKLGVRPGTLTDLMRKWKGDTRLVERANIAEGLEPILRVVQDGKPVVALINANNKTTEVATIRLPLVGEVFTGGRVPEMLHWVVVTGFNRAAGTITYTDTDGLSYTRSFGEFYAKWNWKSGGAVGDFLTGTLGTKERTFIY